MGTTTSITAALIKQTIDGSDNQGSDEDEFGVVGAVAEFKVNVSKFSNHYPQV